MHRKENFRYGRIFSNFLIFIITLTLLGGSTLSQAAPAHQYGSRSEAISQTEWTIYLPLIKIPETAGPRPPTPTLDSINNPDGSGNYTVSWSSSAGAETYTLQEASDSSFANASTVYSGPNTSKDIIGRDIGTYYYRVRAANAGGQSDWSNVQSVVVTDPAESEEWKIYKLPGVGDFPSLALDSVGNPHISYSWGYVYTDTNEALLVGEEVRSDPNIYYLGWDGNNWIKHDVDYLDSAFDINTSLAIGQDDLPKIAYRYANPVSLGLAWWDGASWNRNYISGSYLNPVYVNLALTSDDNDIPFISYLNYSVGSYDIYFSYPTQDGWIAKYVGPAKLGTRSYLFYYHSLALASDDTPHISYIYGREDSEAQLYHATIIDGKWERSALDGQGMGSYSSLALDSQDRPHISYHDHVNGNLKYARWDGGQWQIETVESTGIVGQFTSLALDAQDRPHISYIDATNGHLKYAYWDGSQWHITTIDDSGEVWRWTSLALDDSGLAHIVYRRRYNMRYATNSGIAGE